MKNLKEYIKEGLFDNLDKIEKMSGMESGVELLKKEVIDWIKNNAKGQIYENRFNFDFNTTPITVDYDGGVEFKRHITSLNNNDAFQWGVVGNYFSCSNCESLESLKGCPKEVGKGFNCSYCSSLKSLEGAPKKVSGDFYCIKCGVIFTEDDVKKVSKVKEKIFLY